MWDPGNYNVIYDEIVTPPSQYVMSTVNGYDGVNILGSAGAISANFGNGGQAVPGSVTPAFYIQDIKAGK